MEEFPPHSGVLLGTGRISHRDKGKIQLEDFEGKRENKV